jgi:hypothetical protein
VKSVWLVVLAVLAVEDLLRRDLHLLWRDLVLCCYLAAIDLHFVVPP